MVLELVEPVRDLAAELRAAIREQVVPRIRHPAHVGVRHRPLVLLATAGALAAMLWIMGNPGRALADTSPGLTIGLSAV